MPPKKKDEPVAATVPSETPVVPVDVSTLGIRDHEFVRIHSVVVGKNDLGNTSEIRQTVDVEKIAQPHLNLSEAVKLGKVDWRKREDGSYSTVVEGRRFIITEEIFGQL